MSFLTITNTIRFHEVVQELTSPQSTIKLFRNRKPLAVFRGKNRHPATWHDLVNLESLRLKLTRFSLQKPDLLDVEKHVESIVFEGMKWIADNYTSQWFDTHTLRVFHIYCNYYPQMCRRERDLVVEDTWNGTYVDSDFAQAKSTFQEGFQTWKMMVQRVFTAEELLAIAVFENYTFSSYYALTSVVHERIDLWYGLNSSAGQRMLQLTMQDLDTYVLLAYPHWLTTRVLPQLPTVVSSLRYDDVWLPLYLNVLFLSIVFVLFSLLWCKYGPTWQSVKQLS